MCAITKTIADIISGANVCSRIFHLCTSLACIHFCLLLSNSMPSSGGKDEFVRFIIDYSYFFAVIDLFRFFMNLLNIYIKVNTILKTIIVEMAGIEPTSKQGRHMNLQSVVYLLCSIARLKDKQNIKRSKP
jgi:hypothetical protein